MLLHPRNAYSPLVTAFTHLFLSVMPTHFFLFSCSHVVAFILDQMYMSISFAGFIAGQSNILHGCTLSIRELKIADDIYEVNCSISVNTFPTLAIFCVLSKFCFLIYLRVFKLILAGGFYWRLRDSKSPQIFRILLSVLTELNSVVVGMVSILTQISIHSVSFPLF